MSFDEALVRLQRSEKVLVEVPKHKILVGPQWTILSLDKATSAMLGQECRLSRPNGGYPNPIGSPVFHISIRARHRGRLFLVLLAEVIGMDIITEFGESVADPSAWSVEYVFGTET